MIKKRIIIIILLINCISLYSEKKYKFTVINNVEVCDGNVGSQHYFIEKNTVVEADTSDTYICENKGKLYIYCDRNNDSYEFCDEDLKLQDNSFQIPEELRNTIWIMNYYYEMLQNQNLNYLTENEKGWYPEQKYIEYEDSVDNWYALFKPLFVRFGKYSMFASQNKHYYELSLILEPDIYENGIFKAVISTFDYEDFKNWHPQWKKLATVACPITLYFQLNGDYLYVFKNALDKANLLYILAKADGNTIKQINSFIKTGKFDESKIKYPKHETNNEISSESSSNVLPNKTMTVKEKLKLRSGEATSTQVITVMQTGTKVKILELGKAETIDGINSNWVKVEVQPDAKDREGKPIKAGTLGWCYGGYLE